MAKYCTECSEPLTQDAQFCVACGNRVASTPPAVPIRDTAFETTVGRPRISPPVSDQVADESASARRKRGNVFVLVISGVVLALIIGLVAVLATRGGSDGTVAATDKTRAPEHHQRTTHSPVRSTTTTADPAIKANQDYSAYVQSLENIVQQSTQGRGQIGAATSGVEDCTILPNNASEQINSVISNRTSILNQIAGLGPPPNPEAANLASLLQQALQSSIQADIHYKGWMDYLYANYYYEYPVGCPRGNAPTDSEFDLARAADANSTQLKQQFVDAFNPVATRFRLPTWQENSF
jgi:hypothetical protein